MVDNADDGEGERWRKTKCRVRKEVELQYVKGKSVEREE